MYLALCGAENSPLLVLLLFFFVIRADFVERDFPDGFFAVNQDVENNDEKSNENAEKEPHIYPLEIRRFR